MTELDTAGLADLAEVERLSGIKQSEIYEQMKYGNFPRPRKLSSRCVRWERRAVLAWVDERLKGAQLAPRPKVAA